MDDSFGLIDIKIKDPLRELGVLYVGQYGTSGYAQAAKGYIYDFMVKGIPITWTALKFDDSELTDDSHYNILVKTAINREIKEVLKQALVIGLTYSVYLILASLLIIKFVAYVFK